MPLPRVTGAIWWRMGVSHYQSLFRRAKAREPRKGFTRDYLQASGIMPVLREMFDGREPPYEPLFYRWGSNVYTNGSINPAADFRKNERVRVGQFLGGVPPDPWRIGNPLGNPLVTLPGDPGLSVPDEATAQWEERIEPLRPWLVMVQLDHDQRELHIRAYLEHPTPELAEASFDHVPQSLRELMTARSRPGAGAVGDDVPDLWFDPSDFRDPWKLDPDVEPSGETAILMPIAVTAIGSSYKSGDEDVETAAPAPFDVDPDKRDRATRAHNKTQNALAEEVRARGLEPLSPSGEPDFDLAWETPNGKVVVAEVKSVIPANAERQMRLGLGQVLRYRNLIEGGGRTALALLALSDAPLDPRWAHLCEELEVGLIWMPDLSSMLDDWLQGLDD